MRFDLVTCIVSSHFVSCNFIVHSIVGLTLVVFSTIFDIIALHSALRQRARGPRLPVGIYL